jgi:hypothetical protein
MSTLRCIAQGYTCAVMASPERRDASAHIAQAGLATVDEIDGSIPEHRIFPIRTRPKRMLHMILSVQSFRRSTKDPIAEGSPGFPTPAMSLPLISRAGRR